jgi:ABC-type multidrug transport system, ATPase and permease components
MLKKFISSKFFPSNLFKGRSNPTTVNPVKKIKEDYSAELKEFVYLVRSEKPYFIRNCILSAITSGIVMLFPYALKGITHLTSLRNTPEETETKKADDSQNGIDDTQNPSEQKVKERKSIFLPGDKISPEVKNEYLKFLGTWVPIFILSGILTYSRRFGSGDIANRIAYRLRYRIYSHLMSKDLNFFINQKSASTDYVHKLSNDVTTISNAIAGDLQFFLRGCMFAFGSTAYILINSPQLAIMSVAVAGSLAFSTRNILKKLRESKVKETEALTNLSIIAGERLSNMKLIKVNNTEEYEKKHYLHNLNKFYEESYKVQKYTAMNFGILDGLGQLSVISILTYGSFLITMGYASSEMIAFSMYALYAGMGFRGMFNTLTEMKKSAGLYKGIYDIIGSVKDDPIFKMDFKHFEKLMVEQEEKFRLRKGELLDQPPRIEFKGVNFSYLDTPILKDLTLDIKPGSVVAITGASGSGKSTVLNLLTKLYEPDSGKIYINGRDVSEIDPAWIRLNVSYVTQEPILFMGSILDNIRYGNDNFDTSFENVVKAAKLADAHDFIMALPEQYNTKIGEKGMTLSGGQRQRIVLARALLKDPKILILDESTSALDAESEKSIIKGLSQMVKNRTCLIVTHKLESYQSIVTDTVRL